MQEYELMVLYKPLLLEDIKKNTISKLVKFIEKQGGEMVEAENLGKRLLAYPIRNFEEGHYIQYDLKINTQDIAEFKRQMNLADNILRFIIIKKK